MNNLDNLFNHFHVDVLVTNTTTGEKGTLPLIIDEDMTINQEEKILENKIYIFALVQISKFFSIFSTFPAPDNEVWQIEGNFFNKVETYKIKTSIQNQSAGILKWELQL